MRRSAVVRRLFIVIASVLLSSGADGQPVYPARFPGSTTKNPAKSAQATSPGAGLGTPHVRFRLPALSAEEARQKPGRRLPQTGVRRPVPAKALSGATMVALPDGRMLWRASVASPGARSVRLHFRNFAAGGGAVWVYGSAGSAADAEGPYTGRGPFGNGEFWTGAMDGEEVTIEFAAPPGPDPLPPFEIDSVAHLWGNAQQSGTQSAAGACHLDVSCYPELAQYATGVAQYSFIGDDGGAWVCSGTMINTRNSSMKPYLLTAHHCIGSDSEAKSMLVRFRYQTAVCNGAAPDRSSAPSVNGATYLGGASIVAGDYALVLLNGNPPAGTWFLGWDTSTSAIAVGAAGTGIHHPAGSWKRVSFGSRVADQAADVNGEYAPASLYYRMHWTEGRTEGGSSGSALLNASGQILGTLTYGPQVPSGETICDVDPNGGYGRFSTTYAALRPYLEDSSTSEISANVSALSFTARAGAFTSAAHQTVSVMTNSATPLLYSATASADWIVLSPATGTVSSTAPAAFDVTLDLSKFSSTAKTSGTITISSAGLGAVSVAVSADVTVPASNVSISVAPNPVYQQTADAEGYEWFYRVALTESAGAATTVNSLKIAGMDVSASISSWFGSNRVPAGGALTASLRSKNLTVPSTRLFQASGADDGGRTWATQSSVPFLGPASGASPAALLFPHVADGGEWQTEFLLTNETSAVVTAQLRFHLDGGATTLPVEGLGAVSGIDNVSIPPKGSASYRTTGRPSSASVTGWVEVAASGQLSGQAIFRRHAGDGKYYEGAIPLATPSRSFSLPFDGSSFAGTPFYTGLAIANADPAHSAAVTCSAYDARGMLLGSNLSVASLAPSAHAAAILQWAASTKSVLGTARGLLVCNSTASVGVLGLRAFGNYAITSLPVSMR